MQIKRSFLIFGLISAILFSQFAMPARARMTVDHSIYAQLLKAHVDNGHVDYEAFKTDEEKLDRYLDLLAKVDPRSLDRDEQLAFYINVYNAWTIKLILDNYPGVDSIKDLGTLFRSPWKKKIVNVDGKTVSLDHIEHDIIRPVFQDPRIHFAVNCASIGCPPLLDEPFTGEELNLQLDGVTRRFLNDPKSTIVKGDHLYVNRVFKWFGEDFGDDKVGFIKSHAQGELKQKLAAAGGDFKIKYLDWDWSLNGS